MFLRRSLLNVPGHEISKLKKAISLYADTIVFDLEDGVPLSYKDVARDTVKSFISKVPKPSSNMEFSLRVNSFQSGLAEEDFKALSSEMVKFDSIIFPKVDSNEQVRRINDLMSFIKAKESLSSFICIESPRGIINLREILECSKNIAGIIFGCEDYCAASGVSRTSNLRELLYARSKIVTYAKGYEMAAIDMVCLDFRNSEVLKRESIDGFELGFTGKQVIHPGQIEIVNSTFSPSPEQLERAERISQLYGAATSKMGGGVGAVEVDGIVVDLPVALRAHRLLQLGKAIKEGKNS